MNGDFLGKEIRKQLGETFDITSLKISLDDMVKRFEKSQKKMEKSPYANRFKNRKAIGTLELSSRLQKKGTVHILVDLSNPDLEKDFKIGYDDVLLLYDSKYDRLVSARVDNVIDKKDLIENNCLILVMDLMFSHGANLYERAPFNYISPKTVAYIPTDEEISEIFHIKDIGDNIDIGLIADNSFNFFKVNGIPQYHHYPLKAIKRHMAIIGQTGVGKTIFLKNLIFELAKKEDVNLVVLDIEGDLIQLMEPSDIEKDFEDFPDNKILFDHLNIEPQGLKEIISNQEITFHVPDFFQKYTKKGFLKLYPWEEFGLDSRNIEHGEELAFMMGNLTSKAKEGLTALVRKYIETNPNKEFNLKTFLLFVVQNGRKLKTNYVWKFPGTMEQVKMHQASYESMIRQINNLHNLKLFDQTPGLDFSSLVKKKLVFLYLPHMRGYEKVRILALYRILSEISKQKFKQSMLNTDGEEAKKTIFIIDEAHELLPNNPPSDMKEFFNIINREFSEIGREGRKKGLHLVYATQSMKDINQVVMKNANTKIIFRLPSEDIVNLSRDIKNQVISLKSQFAVIQLPDYPNNFLLRNVPPYFLHTDITDAYKRLKPKIVEVEKVRKKYKKKTDKEKTKEKRKYKVEGEEFEDLPIEEEEVKEVDYEELEQEILEEQEVEEEEEFIPIKKPLENHITNLNGLSTVQLTTKQIKDFLIDIFNAENLIYDHLDSFLNSLAVALNNERVIGIALQGPPGEGKSMIISAILDYICIGGASCIRGLDDQTLEEELFFTENFMPFAVDQSGKDSDKESKRPRYTYGEICKSVFLKTCPILEEANRVQSRFYSGPMFLALDDRRVSFPGGKIIRAYPDWKVFLLMNFKSSQDLNFEMSVLPEALRDRIMFISLPYSPLPAVRKIIGSELEKDAYKNAKVEDNVIDILLELRKETIKRSPLPKHLIGDYYEKEQDPIYEYNGLSIRSILRMISVYLASKSLYETKEEALKLAIKNNCNSVYRSTEPDHYEEFDRILDEIFKNNPF